MAVRSRIKTTKSEVFPDIVQAVVRRILGVAPARRIVLFGSAARGTQNADSDLDFLVIMSGMVNRRQIERQIYANLRGIVTPVDVVVATEDDIQKYGDTIGAIYRPALREGKVVYEAGG